MLWYMISSRGATLSQGHICQGVVTETWICASVGSPIMPRAIRSLAAAMPALQRICWLTAALRPACCAASAIATASGSSSASGFWQSRCLPAARARSAIAR